MGNAIDLLAPVWTHMTQVQPAREGIYLYDAAGAATPTSRRALASPTPAIATRAHRQAIQDQAANLIPAR